MTRLSSRSFAAGACAAFLASALAAPAIAQNPASWTAPTEPFHIVDNVYYVGAEGLSSFLITTPDGHFLLDGTMPGAGEMIAENIAALGFDVADVQILLNSHAHFDHSGGLAELRELSGAELYASEGDKSALENGFYLGWEDRQDLYAPGIKVDHIVEDGQEVTLGGVTLTANITPGHTRGCTSWKMTAADGEESYEVLFFCSASVSINRLAGALQYEGILDDYAYTFEWAHVQDPDIFLINHPDFIDLIARGARAETEGVAAFLNGEDFGPFMDRTEAAFHAAVAQQEAALEDDGE